ncbi:MAG: autotransporter assembly complex family protein [Thermodesulfobacteriota bacterium]
MRAPLAALRLPAAVLLALAWLCLAGAAAAQENATLGPAYVPSIEGAPDAGLAQALADLAETFRLRDRPPGSRLLLERRARADLPAMEKLLRAEGLLKAELDVDVLAAERPWRVVFRLTPGPAFLLGRVNTRLAPDVPGDLPPPPAGDLGLVPGQRFTARKVLDAEAALLRLLGERGHPFPAMAGRQVSADHATDTVDVDLTVDPGPRAAFGDTDLAGLRESDEAHVRSLLPWTPGQDFDLRLLEQARTALYASGLFSYVEVAAARSLDPAGRLPVRVAVTERLPRTVRAGLEYTTDFGPGVKLGWEHRNLLGSGEKLGLTLAFNEYMQKLAGDLKRPRFLRDDQNLALHGEAGSERTDAYVLELADASASLERRLRREVTGSLGLGYRVARVEDKKLNEEQDFGHVYVPAGLTGDWRDDVLDPASGATFGVLGAPYADTLGNLNSFFKYRAAGAGYLEMLDRKRAVLALRGAWGQIWGPGRDDIPADLRFYAGGGGSVRGYAYQTAGSLLDGQPVGGKSLAEVSGEVRLKITDDFGLVPFLDGGSTYEGFVPDFSRQIYWGAGLGLRYYTAVGPIRLDVGFPLDPRPEDDPFQVYGSLGQSF